jgi:predicted Zn finger-like uncharacterized protein
MKFLCPSCKAKYQIADEKVAGRSVRMKCRKCGYLIQISKTVTEGSVSRKLESIEPEPSLRPEPVAPPEPKPGRARPPPRRPQAARAAPRPEQASTPFGAPRPEAARPARAAPRSSVAATPAEQHEVAAVPAQPSNKGNGAAHGAMTAAALGLYSKEDDERTVIAGSGALAGVFSEMVRQEDTSALDSISASADEWYVGINGVPVGPIRLSELRSKAAAGAVTPDSLVWRDGFEEWMALKTFPELVAIIEEGVSSARASLTPLAPNVTPSQPATAGVAEMRDPFAQASSAPAALGDPFASAAQVPGAPITGPAVVTEQPSESDLSGLIPPRRRASWAPWIAVVVAFVFGGTIAFVLFNHERTVVKYVTKEVPAKAAAEQPTDQAGSQTTAAPDTSSSAGAPNHAARVAQRSSGGSEKAKSSGKPLSGLQGLADLNGGAPEGPRAGSGDTHSSGQPLDSSMVERTVSRYTGSVKRSCWQPAIDTRDKDAPSSARVMVSINVAPSGRVESARAGGDPRGYHGLASCIAGRVHGWQFPASSGSTTVNIPFVFATQ